MLLSLLSSGPSSSSPFPSLPFCSAAAAAVVAEEKDKKKKKRRKNLQTTPTFAAKKKIADEHKSMTLNQILLKAGKRGLGGGIPGAVAGVVQVTTLMWLRTIINYQCRYGTTFRQAFTTLLNDGGIPRFYRGLSFALVQAPMSRFVSTAANDGVEALLAALDFTKEWGPGRTTIVASIVVGGWRMLLMPIDTCKTVLQVDSAEGFRQLMRRVKAGKIGVLYQGKNDIDKCISVNEYVLRLTLRCVSGGIAYAVSAIVSHYPWFSVYNFLSKSETVKGLIPRQLFRNAFIGMIASFVSDTVVNSVRVIKTTKQAMGARHTVSYIEAINMVLAADGWQVRFREACAVCTCVVVSETHSFVPCDHFTQGLFGRGLRTRLFSNALQSIVFTVIWRGLAERGDQSPNERRLQSEEEEMEEIYEETN